MFLKIHSFKTDEATLTWGQGNRPYKKTYKIALSSVRNASLTVRDQLFKLAIWGADGEDKQKLPAILRDLAIAGFELRHSLFDVPDDPDRSLEIQDWISRKYAAGDHELFITASKNLHVPWGLVCDQDIYELSADDFTLTSFNEFWALKYSLAATLAGYTNSVSRLQRSISRTRVLSLINKFAVSELCEHTLEELRNAFEELLDRPLGKTTSYSECSKLIRGAGDNDIIFHFFGHQENGLLDLGTGEKINIQRFKVLLDSIGNRRGPSTPPEGLVFLNACGGAFGDSDYSFVYAAERKGFCGLISTESAVPPNYAARFALRFMRSLLTEHRSVGETMYDLRHDASLWPLSLLYGCYAQPGYRMCMA
jgi:hypothetical protein